MLLRLERAFGEDAGDIVALRNAVAQDLTERHGRGPWSGKCTARGVHFEMRIARAFVAKDDGCVFASLTLGTLGTLEPWAIDHSCFTPCPTVLHLRDLVVQPELQRQGLGRRCLEEAARLAWEWNAGVIRLDAFAGGGGAWGFCRACGLKEVGRTFRFNTPLIYFEMPV
jgi:GNAT superfamily N-acetyltransferase